MGKPLPEERNDHLVETADDHRTEVNLIFPASAVTLGGHTHGQDSESLCLFCFGAELLDIDVANLEVFPTKFIELPQQARPSVYGSPRIPLESNFAGDKKCLDLYRPLGIRAHQESLASSRRG